MLTDHPHLHNDTPQYAEQSMLSFSHYQEPVIIQREIAVIVTIEILPAGSGGIDMRMIPEPEPQLQQLLPGSFYYIFVGW